MQPELVIYSLDPGVQFCALAIWEDSVLTCVEYAPAESLLVDHDALILVELPQVYPTSKGDNNDLIQLAFAAGKVAGRVKECKAFSPRTWKGTCKKEIMHKRIEARMTEAEWVVVGKQTKKALGNILDAIGIGLWHFGRLK
jgi:hypothetical protein